jgi:RHS repeat-associated protein
MQANCARSESWVDKAANQVRRGTVQLCRWVVLLMLAIVLLGPQTAVMAGSAWDGSTEETEESSLSPFAAFRVESGPSLPTFDLTGIVGPAVSTKSIDLYGGCVVEKARDIEVLGPRFSWTQDRSYSSDRTLDSASMGAAWFANNGGRRLIQDDKGNVVLLDNASFEKRFTYRNGDYIASNDSVLVLEKSPGQDGVSEYFQLINRLSGDVEIFHDFGSENPGLLKERTTRDWIAQGKAGTEYNYDSGLLSFITTAQGQDYFIGFSYMGSGINAKLAKIEVKTSANGTLLKDVAYTYFTAGVHSATLGSEGDLVQVRTRELKSGGNPERAMDWIVRRTQYRYYRDDDSDGVAHLLKAVFEPDAIQRILDHRTDLREADAILAAGDSDGDANFKILDFASRHFAYNTSNLDTAEAVATVWGSENLQSKYGGNEVTEVDSSIPRYMVKSALVGGCGSCGSAVHGSRHNYYYLDMNPGAGHGKNGVVRLVIDDVIDANGDGAFRTILGLGKGGRKLREALITDPAGTPEFWCKSWKLSSDTSTLLNRLTEYRTPAAHRVSSSTIKKFLAPSAGTNDADTLHGDAGLIEVYDYDRFGFQTAQKIREGNDGEEYYVWSRAFLGGTNPSRQSLLVASYTYPQQVTGIDDASRIGTRYRYDFWEGTDTVKRKITTLPRVPRSQNGSGMHTITEEYYDSLGRLRWTKDGDGYITYYSYHPKFGTESYVVRDADPRALPASANSGAADWITVFVGSADSNRPARRADLPEAIQQVTKSEHDDAGRLVLKVVEDGRTGADGSKHFTVYEVDRTLQFPYWDDKSSKPLMPVEATVTNRGGQTTEIYTVDPACAATVSGRPVGLKTDGQSNYVSWTRNHYDMATGKLAHTDRYHDIPDSGQGTLSTNYHRVAYLYDAMGRRGATIQVVSGTDATKSTVDQVRVTIFDAIGRPIMVKRGVSSGDDGIPASYAALTKSQSPPEWLKPVSQIEYDNGNAGGNRQATRLVICHGPAPTDNSGIQFYYTFRGHHRGTRLFSSYNGRTDVSVTPYYVRDVDWRGHTTAVAAYTTAPDWPTNYADYANEIATGRATLNTTHFDVSGHVYREDKYTISRVDGSKGGRLQTDYYYDCRGNKVAIAPRYSAATEIAYDGLGREYQTRTVLQLKGEDGSGFYSGSTFAVQRPDSRSTFRYRKPKPNSNFASSRAGEMSGGSDQVFAIKHKAFDVAGNVIETHTFDTAVGNGRGLDLSVEFGYVRRSVYSWYDAANRLTAKADYGCGNQATDTWAYAPMPLRPGSAPRTNAAVLVTSFECAPISGRPQLVTNAKGQRKKTFYDALGRTAFVAENYDNFTPPAADMGDPSGDGRDRVTKTEYNGLDKAVRLTVLDQNADGTNNDQTTTYLYEDPYNAQLLTSTIYPDSSDTDGSGINQAKIRYNLDGSMAGRTDQRGTTIQYTLNDRRQLQLESVTALGGDTDGLVRSIKREYDPLGRLISITSYGSADGTGPVRNQVVRHITDDGTVDREWQSHSGTFVSDGQGASPCVRYGFDTSADADGIYMHGLRRNRITYPNGREVHYQYGETVGDASDLLGHITRIYQSDPAEQLLVQYSCLGSGQVTKVDYAEAQLTSSVAADGETNDFSGLDRFGRAKESLWYNYGTETVAVHLRHGYDSLGNLVWREDLIAKRQEIPAYFDEHYAYDGLNRLTSLTRGQLRPDRSEISTDVAMAEQWSLDALGNWSRYDERTYGATARSQSRTHNKVNEITQIDSSSDHIAHDAVGNMVKMPVSRQRSSVAANKGSNGWASGAIIPISYGTSKRMGEVPQSDSWSVHNNLVYDAWNRLVKVSQGGATLAEYEYDGRNFRTVKRTYSGGQLSEARHFFCNSGWQCLEERVEAAQSGNSQVLIPECQYVWGVRYVDDLVLRDRNVSGTIERLYAMQDSNWNVVAIADVRGAVNERYAYAAYGEPSLLDASYGPRAVSECCWDTLFTGRQYDRETGFYYYRNRFYSAELGRFVSRDPVQYKGGINLYAYAGSNPLNMVDPGGTRYGYWKCVAYGLTIEGTLALCVASAIGVCYGSAPILTACVAMGPACAAALEAAATVVIACAGTAFMVMDYYDNCM